jgi:hypothetical protein
MEEFKWTNDLFKEFFKSSFYHEYIWSDKHIDLRLIEQLEKFKKEKMQKV